MGLLENRRGGTKSLNKDKKCRFVVILEAKREKEGDSVKLV